MIGGRWVTCPRAIGAAALAAFLAVVPAAAADAVLYRIFLRDGSMMISYGDFARVGDRVVISVPVGTGERPQLQMVSIAESTVDWQLTERYADAARAKQYADTRGEDDFTLLSSDVARALNEVALTSDPARRVTLADRARQQLAEWPAAHYGYRASDVAQLSALLDEVVSELRVAAGQSRFDLKLVATTGARPAMDLLPPPSLRENIELAFTAARVSVEPAERVSLLESIVRAVESATPDSAWAGAVRTRATAELETEQQVDRAYAQLAARTLARASNRARRADVRAIDGLIRSLLTADARLGHARPNEITALLVAVDAQKTAAQRLRLARDAWSLRAGVLRDYRRQLSVPLDRMARLKRSLEDVRQLAGPGPNAVAQLEERAAVAGRELALVKPPPEFESAHAQLRAACSMAVRAASSRRRAITSGDMQVAWEASSAAAGALMMLERAAEDVKRQIERPQLR